MFYHLMDLSESEQKVYLKKIQTLQPELYKQLSPLISEPSEQFTQLLGFHAHQATYTELELTDTRVDKYQISRELGRGGMGIVYAASRADKTFEQDLAIKFIQPALSHILGKDALFEEAQLLARLNHPNIAKVFDGGVYQGSVYIVMEFIEGTTLSRYLETRPLSDKKKLRLFKSICLAIEHAHQNQILHADIKPENILIDKSFEPKILDFNLTQKLKNSHDESKGSVSAFSQTYASPEQIKGQFLCQQSDVYSLGKVLQLMFPDLTRGSDVACIINKAIQQDKRHRYSSVVEMRHDIQHVLTCRPISLKLHKPIYVTKQLLQRRPLASLLTAMLVASGVIFSSALIYKNQQLEIEKQIAEEMMFEVTSLLFHAKGDRNAQMSISSMLELTRRRILSNPDIPKEVKQKMLLAMMTPVPSKQNLPIQCVGDCPTKN